MRHRRIVTTGMVVLISLTLLGVSACEGLFGPSDADETGTLRLSLTDAPLDDPDVVGVYVAISAIEYNRNGVWVQMEEFDPDTAANPYNLLDLTGGQSALLGELRLPPGDYTQIRFTLDVPDQGAGAPSNPRTYLRYADGTLTPLFVPSGASSGYKAQADAPFSVPANGSVSVTADFDARRSVVVAGNSGRYILKPTLRLVVDGQAGRVSGSLVEMNAARRYTVLAYEDGAYVDSEAADPADGEVRFPTAVSSVSPKDDDSDGTADFTVAYLAAGTYDLYVATYSDPDGDGTFDYVGGQPLAGPADVSVTEAQTSALGTIDVTP